MLFMRYKIYTLISKKCHSVAEWHFFYCALLNICGTLAETFTVSLYCIQRRFLPQL